MTTDTSEKGLERLICTALTGAPCDQEPAQADVAREPTALYGGAGWVLGNWRDYDREYCVDLVQLRTFLADTQPKAAEALDLDQDSPTRRKVPGPLAGRDQQARRDRRSAPAA